MAQPHQPATTTSSTTTSTQTPSGACGPPCCFILRALWGAVHPTTGAWCGCGPIACPAVWRGNKLANGLGGRLTAWAPATDSTHRAERATAARRASRRRRWRTRHGGGGAVCRRVAAVAAVARRRRRRRRARPSLPPPPAAPAVAVRTVPLCRRERVLGRGCAPAACCYCTPTSVPPLCLDLPRRHSQHRRCEPLLPSCPLALSPSRPPASCPPALLPRPWPCCLIYSPQSIPLPSCARAPPSPAPPAVMTDALDPARSIYCKPHRPFTSPPRRSPAKCSRPSATDCPPSPASPALPSTPSPPHVRGEVSASHAAARRRCVKRDVPHV